ncbi:MAG: hypothetical protein ACFFEM_10505 [Candidatus Thorarchaeota archaeon]
MKMKQSSTITIIVLMLFIISSTIVQSDAVSISNTTINSEVAQVDRDVLFTLSKPWSISNIQNPADVAPRSAVAVMNEIGTLVPDGVSIVESVPLYYTEILVEITQIHVIEDRDFGLGEVYLKTMLNSYYEDTHDNGGSFYIVTDGDYVSTSISISQALHSLDGHFSVEIHGWEEDSDADFVDDYMGGELLYFDLTDLTDGSVSGWWYLDYYPPIGGNNAIQVEVEVTVTFSNTELLTYPEDFEPISYDGATLLAIAYMPEVYYDTFDRGDIPGIDCVYYEVYYGFDPSIDDYGYLIYYMFYYEYETDNFGALFGHYYDYEPYLVYIRDIGDIPYRIVYRDVGQYTLPPKVIIQDYYAPSSSGSINVETSGELRPLLGSQTDVEYEYRTTYWDTSAVRTVSSIYGVLPLYETPIMTITNSYHQMELGLVFNRVKADLLPLETTLVPMDDDVLRTGYLRLDEAFESSVNTYEGVSLWNGGDYDVPTNMSLTLDILHNPFQFPYLIDCWEDVAHYTLSGQTQEHSGFTYDLDFELQIEIPATVTLSVPEQVEVNNHYDVGLDVTMHPNDIILRFIYDIDFGFDIQWWFLDFNKHATFDGQFEFAIPLETIQDSLNSLELDSEGVSFGSLNNYVTVAEFQTSTDLLGTMIDAEVEIHLLSALSDLLSTVAGIGSLLKVLSIILDDVNLVASPTLSGELTATISTSNDAISLDTSEVEFSEGDTSKTLGMTVIGGHAESGILIQNMTYHMLFSTDWELEFDFTDGVNLFVDDFGVSLGTFPDITLSSDDHSIEANTATGFDAPITMMLSGGGLPGLTGDSNLLVIGILGGVVAISVVAIVIFMKKRNTGV